jgi:hypothetical protein
MSECFHSLGNACMLLLRLVDYFLLWCTILLYELLPFSFFYDSLTDGHLDFTKF